MPTKEDNYDYDMNELPIPVKVASRITNLERMVNQLQKFINENYKTPDFRQTDPSYTATPYTPTAPSVPANPSNPSTSGVAVTIPKSLPTGPQPPIRSTSNISTDPADFGIPEIEPEGPTVVVDEIVVRAYNQCVKSYNYTGNLSNYISMASINFWERFGDKKSKVR